MFSPRIPPKSLALACRSLSTMLGSGVPIERAFNLAAEKISESRCRRAMRGIAEAVARGEEVSEAMRAQGQTFPELMIEMTDVAEQTGALPEILRSLADHYDNLVRLRREFLTSITWPAVQFTLAVFVIALLIYVLGWIAQSRGGQPLDVLGFGLYGAKGALLWLAMVGGVLLSLWTAYQMIARTFAGQRVLHGLLMRIPAIGGCMRSFAIARFSWAFYLTQQTGMPVDDSLRASLQATNNGVFIDRADLVCRLIREGETLSTALHAAKIFPADYLSMVEVAETSGTVPEALHRLSPQFEEDARRSLAVLATLLGWGVWLLVAGFIIFLIFRIALWYVGMINDAVNAIK